MSTIDEIGLFLNQISRLGIETLSQMDAHSTEMKLKKNEYFVKSGEVSREVGILVKGIVRSFYVTKEGKEYNKNGLIDKFDAENFCNR